MVVKKLIAIFALAFLLNLIWENLHSWLYAYYEGGVITEWILLRATLFDAIFITLLFTKPALVFHNIRNNRRYFNRMVCIEYRALGLQRCYANNPFIKNRTNAYHPTWLIILSHI